MNLLTNVKLFEPSTQKQKNNSHLAQPNFTQFIKVCESHQEIVTAFMSSPTCKKTCLICPSCRKHKHDKFPIYEKHEPMDLKSFVDLIDEVKKGYLAFHHVYTNEVLPVFLQNLKIVVLQFFRQFEKRNEDTVLIENFQYCHRNANKKIHQLLNSEVEDWNLNEFTCSDLSELILLKEKVTAKPVEELKEYVCDDLKNMLKKVLVHYGLINGSQKKDKEELLVKGNLQEVMQQLKQLENKVQLELKKSKPIEVLYFQLSDQSQQFVGGMPSLKHHPKNYPYSAEPENQQEHNQKLGLLLEQLTRYLQKSRQKIVKLELNIPQSNKEFWEFFVDQLFKLDSSLLESKSSRLEEMVIYAKNCLKFYNTFCGSVDKQTAIACLGSNIKQPVPQSIDASTPIELKMKSFLIKLSSPKPKKLLNI